MRGGRTLILIGLIVLLGAVAVGVILWRIGGLGAKPAPSPEVTGEAGEAGVYVEPPTGMLEIVVAAQNIPRGTRITADAVQKANWPDTSVPQGTLTNVEDALGRIARLDMVLDMPVTEGMVTDKPGDLGGMGSDAALQIPAGKVAYALPVSRYAGVAWALQPGDHVDVIISLLVTDLDEEFQTALPDNAACVQPPEGEECQGGIMGRLQVLGNGWVVNLTPGEAQRPRLVTQMTVQDAIVLYIGDWSLEEGVPTPEGGAPPVDVQAAEGEAPPPAPTRAAVEPVTLIVTPQDAMVLKYAEEVGASIDLVLRSAGDVNQVPTESVTLQYLFERFGIELPPKLPYGVTPPIYSLPSSTSSGSVAGGTTGQTTEQ